MTGKNCDLFTHKSFRSYLNHLVYIRRIFKSQAVQEKFISGIIHTEYILFKILNLEAGGKSSVKYLPIDISSHVIKLESA
jgi:hypothetical protein